MKGIPVPDDSACALVEGKRVAVFSMSPGLTPKLEGMAELIRPICLDNNLYLVRFDGEPRLRRRHVFSGDWQRHPYRMLRDLNLYMHAALHPELLHDFHQAEE